MPPPQRPTHFLALPLHPLPPAALPPLHTALQTLHAHLPPHLTRALRPPETLHLTLGVLTLPSPTALAAALTLLETIPLPAAPAPTIRLRGLAAVGRPARTSVLYAVPEDDSGALAALAGAVRAPFAAAGMVQGEVRLHVTLVNTVYLAGRGRAGGRGRAVFDARAALEWGRGVVFVDSVVAGRVCLCRMGEVWVGGVCAGYLEVGTRVLGQEEEEEEEEGGVAVEVF